MPGKLGPPKTKSWDRRPHQTGIAAGTKNGCAVTAKTEWLFDTGAEIAVLTKKTADQFDLTPTAGSASATTGGGGILIKSGLTTKFEIEDSCRSAKTVTCKLDVGVKPNNSGSDLLGMDQLNDVDAAINWDPGNRSGQLFEV
jgi:hypothetical protein